VWIDAAGDDQLPPRVDLTSTRRCRQVLPDLGDRPVTNAEIAFGPSDSGDDQSMADEDLGRLLDAGAHHDSERESDRRGPRQA
jgi:hypothetical protein